MRNIEQIWICLGVKPSGFADRLDINERERGVKDDSKVFGLTRWKAGGIIKLVGS